MTRLAMMITLFLGCLAAGAAAQEIYRWVDENGVVHFSDRAPEAAADSVTTVAVEDTRPSDYDPEADLYNVTAQAERMQALREEMQAEREARLERQRTAARQQPPQNTQSVGYTLPPWWSGQPGSGRPPRPPQRPEPPDPGLNPPSTLRPPGQARNR